MNFIKGITTTFCATVILFSTTVSQAQESTNNSNSNSQQSSGVETQTPNYQNYFTINEQETDNVTVPSPATPASFSPDQFLQSTTVVVVNLLKWVLHNSPLEMPQEKYARKAQFGRWVNDPTDDTCMNTRARVLVRDSEVGVTYKTQKQCVVETGEWLAPYENKQVTDAKEIQIDHLVPLKNAYINGASDWDYQTRCLYANYMNFAPHLISAGAHENMSKGDSGPEKYLPPTESYRCEYVRNWLAVKAIWKLKMNPDEVRAIHDTIVKYSCKLGAFMMSKDGLAKQRDFIQSNLNFCVLNKR